MIGADTNSGVTSRNWYQSQCPQQQILWCRVSVIVGERATRLLAAAAKGHLTGVCIHPSPESRSTDSRYTVHHGIQFNQSSKPCAQTVGCKSNANGPGVFGYLYSNLGDSLMLYRVKTGLNVAAVWSGLIICLYWDHEVNRVPSQYKDRLISVWRFLC